MNPLGPHPSRWLGPAALAILLVGCGGGGGGGGNNSGTDLSQLSNVRIDAAFVGSDGTIGNPVDPLGIFPGETVRFRLTGVDVTGTRVYVNVSGFSSVGLGGGGQLRSDGTFIAGSPTGPFAITVRVGDESFTSAAQVRDPQAVLTGRIRLVSGGAAPRIEVKALDASGTVVGSGFSASDGTLRIATLPSATRFTLDYSTVDPTGASYVRQFAYNGTDYSTLVAGCSAPLPALGLGSTVPFADDLVVYLTSSQSPPPPPDGCNGNF